MNIPNNRYAHKFNQGLRRKNQRAIFLPLLSIDSWTL